MDHGSPVECGCPFPKAALYASGGGTSVKVWDLAMTGKTLQDLPDAHSKAGKMTKEKQPKWLQHERCFGFGACSMVL